MIHTALAFSGKMLVSLVLALGGGTAESVPALRVERVGIERASIARTAEGWSVTGTARCEWPATPSRSTIRVEALDARGRVLGATEIEASPLPRTARHKRDVHLTFRGTLPVVEGVVSLRLAP